MSDSRFYKLDQALAARQDLPLVSKILYAVIVDHIGHNRDGWPGHRRLAKKIGCKSMDTVHKGIDALEKAGVLTIERPGNGKSNRYRLSAPPGGAVPKTKRTARRNTGAPRSGTEAHRPAVQNQTDSLNQTINNAAGKPPPDNRIKEFIGWFSQEFAKAQGRPYIVSGGKDGATVKRLLRSLDGNGRDALTELQQAARNMLADEWGKTKADIGLLGSKINSWRSPAELKRQGSLVPAKSADESAYAALEKRY